MVTFLVWTGAYAVQDLFSLLQMWDTGFESWGTVVLLKVKM